MVLLRVKTTVLSTFAMMKWCLQAPNANIVLANKVTQPLVAEHPDRGTLDQMENLKSEETHL